MMISTRGRYALRVMVDLAENSDGSYIAMRQVAERQNISLKYLEKIMPSLVSAGLIEGVQGKGGGYRLTREPYEYPVGEILRLTEGDLAPVACLEDCPQSCGMESECRTRPLWNGLEAMINQYLDGVSVADLMRSGDKSLLGPQQEASVRPVPTRSQP